jgi:cell wall-associated NlpC family hydrolase
MRRINTTLTIVFALVLSLAIIYPAELTAKSNQRKVSLKKKHNKKSRKHYRKQSIDESLERLQQYAPELYEAAINEDDDNFDQSQISSLTSSFDNNSIFSDISLRINLIKNINDWLGTRYSHGGHSKRGVDCSNFTSCMITETIGKNFPSSCATQSRMFTPIRDISDLQTGDLIFFSGRNKKSNRIGHVGFYIGNGLFAHSSTGRGVIYTHISEGYYSQRYRYGGRLINDVSINH